MTFFARLFAGLTLCFAVSACTQPQQQATTPAVPRDTGNMAYPTPLPAGNVNTVRPQ